MVVLEVNSIFTFVMTIVNTNIKHMDTLYERKRRSEKMTKDEHKAFLKFIGSFETKTDASDIIGISRPTLDAIIYKASGKPETISKIRKVLSAA